MIGSCKQNLCYKNDCFNKTTVDKYDGLEKEKRKKKKKRTVKKHYKKTCIWPHTSCHMYGAHTRGKLVTTCARRGRSGCCEMYNFATCPPIHVTTVPRVQQYTLHIYQIRVIHTWLTFQPRVFINICGTVATCIKYTRLKRLIHVAESQPRGLIHVAYIPHGH
jgi:hypothetical protein